MPEVGFEPQTSRFRDCDVIRVSYSCCSIQKQITPGYVHCWFNDALYLSAPCDDKIISQYTLSFCPISYHTGFRNTLLWHVLGSTSPKFYPIFIVFSQNINRVDIKRTQWSIFLCPKKRLQTRFWTSRIYGG